MEKPGMPNIPGMSAMTDTLEFVKNLWGGMKVPGVGMPGMVMPTLSVDEINKQIADLKAVESWLAVNMNMLRGTIQALEVQSATLTTLKTMGDNLNAAMQAATADASAAGKQTPVSTAAESDAKAEEKEEARRKTRSRLKEEFTNNTPEPEAGIPSDAAPAAAEGAGGNGNGNGQTDFGAPLANPAVWWNLLQDQFKQAVGTAMSPETAAKPAAAPKPAAKPSGSTATAPEAPAKRKPRPKTH